MENSVHVYGYGELYTIDKYGNVYSNGRYLIRSDGRPRTVKPKQIAQTKNSKGYFRVSLTSIDGIPKAELVHRLMLKSFLYTSDLYVDHIDGNKENNRLSNLRYCTNSENLTFRNAGTNYKSPHPGIYIDQTRKKKYMAVCRVGGKQKNLGRFLTLDEALAERAKYV